MKISKLGTIAIAFCMIAQNALVLAGKDDAKKEEKSFLSRTYEFVCEHKGKIAAALACILIGNERLSRYTGSSWSISNQICPGTAKKAFMKFSDKQAEIDAWINNPAKGKRWDELTIKPKLTDGSGRYDFTFEESQEYIKLKTEKEKLEQEVQEAANAKNDCLNPVIDIYMWFKKK
jgi:hypothetical protein